MPINPVELLSFTGTEKWHRWSALFPKMLLTDGAMYVAENAGDQGAYWLMDAIASYQPELQKSDQLRRFQLWTLEVDTASKTALLKCQEDSDIPPIVTQKIDYTDFDIPEMRLYCMPLSNSAHTILLPSEY